MIVRRNSRKGVPYEYFAKKDNWDFSKEILDDLLRQGFTGEELEKQFYAIKNEIPNCIKAMLHEAQLVAEGKADFQSYEDVFE